MGQQSISDETTYIDHPRIREEALESRTYQEVIAASATQQNSLAVLPTGLGKTAIGILLAAHRLEERPGSKILMLAPTRPLVEQHKESFQEFLKVDTDVYQVLTGDTRPEKRETQWKEVGCFFATPQVVENDIINERLDLDEFSLVIFDEVHRATGEYPYKFIAESYMKGGNDTRILGLTASPGSSKEKIKQIADDLYIDNFEIRTEDDPDVKPYIEEKQTHWVKVDLDKHFKRVKRHLEAAQRKRLKKLKGLGLLDSTSNVHKGDLLKLRGKLGSRIQNEDDPDLYQGMSHVAACMKVQHCLELLETQGVQPLYRFFEKMKKDKSTKAARTLLNDEEFQNAVAVTEWMYTNGKEHPKMGKLKELLRDKMTDGENAIVFTQFRDTVDLLHGKLGEVAHLEPVKFKGQKEGFTQKKQLDILEKFRDGEYNVLVSTSVGEEGLDIPAVDYVIFYEPIPSEVRSIQRKGRTGRQEEGVIYVLMAKNTRDEGYYWSAKNKEDKMKNIMKSLKNGGDGNSSGTDTKALGGQKSLDGFSKKEKKVKENEPKGSTKEDEAEADDTNKQENSSDEDSGDNATNAVNSSVTSDDNGEHEDPEAGIVIFSDDRENKIMKALSKKDVKVRSTRLEVGDFLVSDRTAVERKRADDFVSSLIDNRLFPQLKELTQEFVHPILIIEGDDLFQHRNVHPNAIRGALSSIVLDYKIPILWADDRDETVELLVALARREQEDKDRSVSIRGEKSPQTEAELQKFIVAGLPNVSNKLAGRLLKRFGNVRSIFTASETELKKVEGIGEEKASRIKEILEKEYVEGG